MRRSLAFERSLALAPSIQDYAFRKALTYYMLERFPDAVTTFELALTLPEAVGYPVLPWTIPDSGQRI